MSKAKHSEIAALYRSNAERIKATNPKTAEMYLRIAAEHEKTAQNPGRFAAK